MLAFAFFRGTGLSTLLREFATRLTRRESRSRDGVDGRSSIADHELDRAVARPLSRRHLSMALIARGTEVLIVSNAAVLVVGRRGVVLVAMGATEGWCGGGDSVAVDAGQSAVVASVDSRMVECRVRPQCRRVAEVARGGIAQYRVVGIASPLVLRHVAARTGC